MVGVIYRPCLTLARKNTNIAVAFGLDFKRKTNLQIDHLPTCSSTIHAVIPWGGRRSNSLDIFQLQCSRRHANKCGKATLQSWKEEGTSMMMRDAHSSSQLGFS